MPSTPRRVVLSVGIGDYDRTCLRKLHGSVPDAVSFARTAALTPGFHAQNIDVLKDPSCKDLKLRLLQMQSQISEAPTEVELVLVHLSGHGMTDSHGVLHLVCKDFEGMSGYTDTALEHYGVQVSFVLKCVKAANRVVVVFDACRRHEPLAGCLMDVHSIGNALIVYSCAPGSLAFDGFLDGQGYLTHLIEHLFDPRKSIYRALRDTEEATKRGTNELQQPQTVVYAQHLYENYYIGKADNTGPTVETSSSTAQQHASDVAKLFQLYEDTKRKFSEYQKVLKCRQVLEKALKQVVLPGDYLVAHEQHRYPFSIIQVKKDVSAQDFTNNLEAEGVCTSCKPKAEKAFRTKRGDKLEFRLGKKEQQDVQTPSVSEERSSKRQRVD